MMRGTPGMRLALAILSPVFLVLCFFALRGEEARPWMRYQEEFKQLYVARAGAKLKEAESGKDARQQARWQRVIDEVSRAQPEIAQVYIQELNLADRCVTCHRGIDNPLFQDAPQPFRTHSGDLLRHHEVNTFGCTPCHDGQGGAISVEGAHGREANWLKPLLPAAYLQSSCARCHEVTLGLPKAEMVSRGDELFMEKGCYGCHDARGTGYRPRVSPPLTYLKSKLKDPQSWVYAWIKNPVDVSPDTTMPSFKLDDEKVGAIAAFLLTLSEAAPAVPVTPDGGLAKEGERLFVERGCLGCHAVKADEHSVAPRVPHLSGIGSKTTAQWLDRWLADPRVYNSDTAMPKTELTDGERQALVAYLVTLTRAEGLAPAPDLSRFDPEEGRRLVKRYECFGCHAIAGFERARPAVPNLAEFARKPVDELDFGLTTDVPRTKWNWLRHKLREPRAYEWGKIELLMPVVGMTDDEAQALVAYVLAFNPPALPARYKVNATPAQWARRDLTWMVAHLNCNSCHQWNERDARIAQFLDRQNATAPSLNGVAERLSGRAIYQFVLEPKRNRPWLGLRMPDFGLSEAHVGALVDGFASVANIVNPHTDVATLNIIGPPLNALHTKVADPNWLVAWLLRPSHVRPGTAMPDVDLTVDEVQAAARFLYADGLPAVADPNWLMAWLLRPSRVRPGTAMSDADLMVDEVQAAASFLYADRLPAAAASPWRGGDPEQGKQLFVSRGCRGCHAIQTDERSVTARVPNLAGVGLKVGGDWLFAWLKAPRTYSPRTAMPLLTITDEEIRHLVAFLLSRRDGAEVLAAAPRFNPGADRAAGKAAIERTGCAKCHEIEGLPVPSPAVVLAPDSPVNSTDATLRNGRALVENYNCRACHKIEGGGGEIAAFLDRKTFVPPILDLEGARVQTSWLIDFLKKPTSLRPWLQLRMPDFGVSEGDARTLAKYFAALAGVPARDEPMPAPRPQLSERGLRRFAQFKCVQCHPVSPDGKIPEGAIIDDLSINLMLAKTRLRPSWIPEFLARPKAIAGMQTRMPSTFFTSEGTPNVDNPEQDIAAITAYLLVMTEPPQAALAHLEKASKPAQPTAPTDWQRYQY